MAQLPFSINIILIVLLSWSDASPVKPLVPSEVLPIGKTQMEKPATDSVKVLPINNVITESLDGKLKEKKSLFGINESSLIKLKGIKVIPKDSGKSNIMKILFPRKQLVGRTTAKPTSLTNKTNDPVVSSVHNESVTESGKEFIEVDDILLVRDPKDLDDQINNLLDEEKVSTTEINRPIYMEPIDKIDTTNLTLAERLKIAAKRRMMDKMAKLELNMQRELFKREDTQRNKGPNIEDSNDKVTEGTMTGTVKDALTEVAAEAEVLSETEAPKSADIQQADIQSTEGPKQDELISATLSTITANEEENKAENDEPSLGAALPSNNNDVQAVIEPTTASIVPAENQSDQLSSTTVSETENTTTEKETVLGSSLPVANSDLESIGEGVKETNNGNVAEATTSINEGESLSAPLERGEEKIQANLPDGGKAADKQEANQPGSEIDVPKPEPAANVDDEEPTVGAAFIINPSSAQDSVPETSTENVKPMEAEKAHPSDETQAKSDIDPTKLEQTAEETVGAALEQTKDENQSTPDESVNGESQPATVEVVTSQALPNEDSTVDDVQSTTPPASTVAEVQAVSNVETVKSDDAEAIVGAPLEPPNSDNIESTTAGTKVEEAEKTEEVTQPAAAAESNSDKTETGDGIVAASRNSQTSEANNNNNGANNNSNNSPNVLDESESSNAQNSENQQNTNNNQNQNANNIQNQDASNNQNQNSQSNQPSSNNQNSSQNGQEQRQNEQENNQSNNQSEQSNSRNSNSQNSQDSQSNSQDSSNANSNSESSNQQNSRSSTNEQNAPHNSRPASNARSRVDSVFSHFFSNTRTHPLLSRILFAAAEPSRQSPQSPFSAIFRQQQQSNGGLLSSPLIPLFKIQTPVLRSKKHAVKRAVDEEEVFLTPKPYAPFESPSTTRRPTLLERYHAMDSDEKVERVSKVLERIMHGVTIAGHVDGYLTNRAKATIKKLHKLFATEETD